MSSIQSPLRNRYTLFLSCFISYIGTACSYLAGITLFSECIYDVTYLSFFFGALAVPPLLFRRYVNSFLQQCRDLRRLLVIVEGLRFILLLSQSICIYNNYVTLRLLCIFLALSSLLNYLFIAALFIYHPLVIEKKYIGKYLSYVSSIAQTGWFLGAMVFILGRQLRFGYATFFLIDGISYLASGLLFCTLNELSVNGNEASTNSSKEDKAVPHFLKHSSFIQKAFLIALPLIIGNYFEVVASATSLKLSARGAKGLSLLEGMTKLGMLLVGILYPLIPLSLKATSSFFTSLLGSMGVGITLLLLYREMSLHLLVLNAILFGVGYGGMLIFSRHLYYQITNRKNDARIITLTMAFESIGQLIVSIGSPLFIKLRLCSIFLFILFICSSLTFLFFSSSYIDERAYPN